MAVKPRVLMDGPEIEGLRTKEPKITQEELASRAGVALTVIRGLKKVDAGAVLWETANAIAGALGVGLDSISRQYVYPDGLAMLVLPGVTVTVQDELYKACDFDVDGKYQTAIDVCDKLLASAHYNWEEKTLIKIRRASFHDNMGRHQEALDSLVELIATAGPQNGVGVQLLRWAQYHKAIALRRLGELEAAENELRLLLLDSEAEYWYATIHQLGVVCLKRAQKGPNNSELDNALDHFQIARTHWKSERNHREGFALRGMGQALAEKGLMKESIEHFFEAAIVLARCRCSRYVEETRKELSICVLKRLTP